MAQFTNCLQSLFQSPGNSSDRPQPARLPEKNLTSLTATRFRLHLAKTVQKSDNCWMPAGRIELPPLVGTPLVAPLPSPYTLSPH